MTTDLSLPNNISIDIPDNEFERIVYLQSLVERLQKIQEECSKFVEEELIRLSQMPKDYDEKYEVVPYFDTRKSTNILIDRLKEEHPDLYRECLSINGPNAMKLLGEDKLWALCIKYAGEERTMSASSLTLKQMKKVLTDEEYKQYTQEVYKQKGLTVSRK